MLLHFGYTKCNGAEVMQRDRRAEDETGTQPVLVVDGDHEYCAFITDVLQRAGYISQFASGKDAVAFARRHRPAAVILDVILPGATGYEVCRELREEHGEHLPIMFVSGERTEPADRVGGFLIGADDYLVKPVDPDELVARLRRLIERAAAPRDDAAWNRSDAFATLTTRESEVLRLLAHGLNQEDIARDLSIRPATVGTHIQRILTKLDVHSRTQAVALAYRERLVEQT
jgi:DNA-binding NarL/FixJ family response regulator